MAIIKKSTAIVITATKSIEIETRPYIAILSQRKYYCACICAQCQSSILDRTGSDWIVVIFNFTGSLTNI